MTNNTKKIIFILSILFIILSINSREINGGKYLKTNINTQVNTIAEIYNYTLLINSNNSFKGKDTNLYNIYNNKLVNDVKLYKSKYSNLAYKPFVNTIKKNVVMLGSYEFSFNDNIHFININDESSYSNDKKIFKCIIKVYLIDDYIYSHFPECNYQNLSSFNKEFNYKVKEVIILSYLNNIIYTDSNYFNKDIDINFIHNKLDVYNFSRSFPKFSYNITSFEQNVNSTHNLSTNNKNFILSVAVKLPLDLSTDKYETCEVKYFYPNMELTPDFIHGEVKSCG